MTGAAHAEDACASGLLEESAVKDGILYMKWIGTVRYEMDKQIARKFDKVKDKTVAVILVLSSCGGGADAKAKTVDVLKRIKRTHILFTMVGRGSMCASACVEIFLQGKKRHAALTSSWAFHEPSVEAGIIGDGTTIKRFVLPEQTETMLKSYAEAGVSKRWLKRLRAKIKGAELWQTGRDLWEAKSGLFTEVMGNSVPRVEVEEQHFAPAVICGALCRG